MEFLVKIIFNKTYYAVLIFLIYINKLACKPMGNFVRKFTFRLTYPTPLDDLSMTQTVG